MTKSDGTRLLLVVLALGGAARVVAACSADDETKEPEQACVPGDLDSCPCPAGGEGVQTCADDGSRYGACEGCGEGGAGQGGTGAGGSAGGTASGGSGGSGNGGSGGATSSSGSGGSALPCVDLAELSPHVDFPACDVADQAGCVCEGCDNDDICFDAGLGLADDCVCPDCSTDKFCANPTNCVDDGLCDPYYEGCICLDCAAHPACDG